MPHDSDFYRIFLSSEDVDMVVSAARKIDGLYGYPLVAISDEEESELVDPFDDSFDMMYPEAK